MLLSTVSVARSSTHGMGLFATQEIRRGSIVWHPCRQCEVWGAGELELLPKSEFGRIDEYGYWLADGGILLPCSDAYLMNHSCDAAVLDFGLDFGVSVRDLAAGEEITCDYRTFINDPTWQIQCKCGSRDCVGVLTPSQGLDSKVQSEWREKLSQALRLIPEIKQPLEKSLMQSSLIYKRLKEEGLSAALCEAASITRPSFLVRRAAPV